MPLKAWMILATLDDGARDIATGRPGHDALLGRVLPGALHELANPLLALGGTVELLLADPTDEGRRRAQLELVGSTSAEIANVVRTLQRLARERLEPETEISLPTFVAETAGLARRFANVRDVGLDELASPAPAAIVRARPAALRQALLLPLLDALQAAPPATAVGLAVEGTTVRLTGPNGAGTTVELAGGGA
jgi:signal transduction histidine kinase